MGTRSYFRKARNTGNPSHCPTISEVKAANGDFTDSAAARVQTSRGMPKMQPTTLTNIAAVTKRCLTSEPRQCIQMDSLPSCKAHLSHLSPWQNCFALDLHCFPCLQTWRLQQRERSFNSPNDALLLHLKHWV